jgi:hypothetical protein
MSRKKTCLTSLDLAKYVEEEDREPEDTAAPPTLGDANGYAGAPSPNGAIPFLKCTRCGRTIASISTGWAKLPFPRPLARYPGAVCCGEDSVGLFCNGLLEPWSENETNKNHDAKNDKAPLEAS